MRRSIRLDFLTPTAVRLILAGGLLLVLVMAIAFPLSGDEPDSGGAARYTPTKGEWLCLFLNVRQALVNSEQIPTETAVRYLYDHSRPNTIRVEVLCSETTPKEFVRHRATEAEREVQSAAQAYNWHKWLKIETTQRQVANLPASELLLR
jgi:hypothetical protein